MKINMKLKLFLPVVLALFVFQSCEDITELNVNPNAPTAVPPAFLVSEAQYQINDRLAGRNLNAEWGMLMVQHWAQNEYAEESRYVVDVTSFDAAWIDLYANALSELDEAKKQVTANEGLLPAIRNNQIALIDILMAYTYHNLTDAYGAIPLSQALSPLENPLPDYDTQPEVYASIVSMLQGAISSMDAGAAIFDTGDNVYNNNAAMWKSFANSLLFRVAMRMADVDESGARTIISGLNVSDMIVENSQNAVYEFEANDLVANPLYIDVVVDTRDDFSVTEELITELQDRNDPRISAYVALNPDGVYQGQPFGLIDAEAFALKPFTSRPAPDLRAATAPTVMMDAAEVHFLVAEAIERGFMDGDAAEFYASGIARSMEYWGFDQAAAVTYVEDNPYDGYEGGWRQALGIQKWLAFYMNGLQAWAEWRRLDYPQLEVPEAGVTGSIPVRLPYPLTETTTNGSSLDAVTSNPNDITTKLWWDVN